MTYRSVDLQRLEQAQRMLPFFVSLGFCLDLFPRFTWCETLFDITRIPLVVLDSDIVVVVGLVRHCRDCSALNVAG